MNSSPFKSFAEFSGATGSIEAFSTMPAFNYVCIALVAAIVVLLVVKSYLTKH
jgi:hypothetical protein